MTDISEIDQNKFRVYLVQKDGIEDDKCAAPVSPSSYQTKKLLISVSLETHTELRIRAIREGKTLEAVSRDILNAGVAQT